MRAGRGSKGETMNEERGGSALIAGLPFRLAPVSLSFIYHEGGIAPLYHQGVIAPSRAKAYLNTHAYN